MNVSGSGSRVAVPGTPHFVEGGMLHLASRGRDVARLALVPTIDGNTPEISAWHQQGLEIVGHMKAGGAVHLARRGDYLAYWVGGNYDTAESVVYFSGSTVSARQYRCFGSGWPERILDMSEAIGPGTSARGRPVGGARDKQNWLATPSPRDVAFRCGDTWWGICIPGALPLGETIVHVRRGRLSIELRHCVASNIRGNLPTAYIIIDLDRPSDLLGIHVALCRERKELSGPKPSCEWWSKPILGIRAAQASEHRSREAPLTAENVRACASLVREKTGIDDFTVAIEAPWFDKYGDFSASTRRFGGAQGMRALTDDLHAAGSRVLLWFTPFKIDLDSDAAITQPDCLLMDRAGRSICLDASRGCRDYTSAAARNTLINNLRYMLSDAEECLNADGLQIDLTGQNPAGAIPYLKNPRWGAGDEYWANLLRHIHQDAHGFKSDCLVATGELMPCLAQHTDMIRLGDMPRKDGACYFERAMCALRLMPGTLISAGAWMIPPAACGPYWATVPVLAVPALYCMPPLESGHQIAGAEFRRVAAAWHAYANAPLAPDMEVVAEPEANTFYRKYTSGPLAGHYAAIGFEGRCFATFSPRCARVVAVRDTEVVLPVPSAQRKLEAVCHDGSRRRLKITASGRKVTLAVPDAASDVRYLEIGF